MNRRKRPNPRIDERIKWMKGRKMDEI